MITIWLNTHVRLTLEVAFGRVSEQDMAILCKDLIISHDMQVINACHDVCMGLSIVHRRLATGHYNIRSWINKGHTYGTYPGNVEGAQNQLSLRQRCSTEEPPLFSFGEYAMDMYSLQRSMFFCSSGVCCVVMTDGGWSEAIVKVYWMKRWRRQKFWT